MNPSIGNLQQSLLCADLCFDCFTAHNTGAAITTNVNVSPPKFLATGKIPFKSRAPNFMIPIYIMLVEQSSVPHLLQAQITKAQILTVEY
jgi:hypothetical protein